MLPREDGGVVDSRLRVYGVSGLRVADVSVLPVMVSSRRPHSTSGHWLMYFVLPHLQPDNHPSGSAYMIGEKAAEFLKANNGL